ncbi:MAG: beta-propeller fold lactonase family protein [Acidobacteriia bacterium]|nr:beta-propeller fold lactonase family protein [Terriglobia bacterium]
MHRARILSLGLATLIALASSALLPGDAFQASRDGSTRARYAVPEDDLYKSPIQMALSGDGRRLFVACENSGEVLVIDTAVRRVVSSMRTGRNPFGVALSPDESRLYVSNRWDDNVTVFNVGTMEVIGLIPVGDDPHGLVTDETGRYLFVANLGTDDVSVINTADFKEIKRLEAGRSPFGIAFSPDHRFLYVSSQLSVPVPFRTPPILELTVIDAKRQVVAGRRQLFSTLIGQDLAVSPDNRFVVVALELPKNLLPETQVYQGWMVTHGFAVAEAGPQGRVAYFLLDEPNLYYADPFGVAFSPDGQRLYISSSGVNAVTVIDMRRVAGLLQARDGKIGLSDEAIGLNARNLGLSSEYVLARVPTQCNPKDMVASPDGRWIYVANRLSDSIQVIDAGNNQVAGAIDLGGPSIETVLRRGARLFNYSSISFQKQLSCNTCHPENHLDGLVYDIVAPGDGIGRNLVENRTMRDIADTAPYKWSGTNPTLQRQDGPRAAQLFFRSHGFEKDDLEATVHFIESLSLMNSRYAPADGRLNEFQRRGRAAFERAYTKDGRYIPVANRCITCHPAPYYTDCMTHDVGTQANTDDSGEFDTPQLGDIYDTSPFLHDGRCYSLEEIWTVFNPGDTHGVTNDMAKENLNELIEYIKTLWVGEPVRDKELFASLFVKSTTGNYRLRVEDLDSLTRPGAKYIGNEVCGTCHAREYKKWLGTRHSRSWVMLGMTEKADRVKSHFNVKSLSPQNSAICLKCHGTAAGAPPEFRLSTFHVEEGVQCESCHGPGEQYATEEVMKNKQQAIALGLRMPTKEVCLNCHMAKPSHEFMNKKPFDFEESYKKIAHMH